jgi:hypothetical protein
MQHFPGHEGLIYCGSEAIAVHSADDFPGPSVIQGALLGERKLVIPGDNPGCIMALKGLVTSDHTTQTLMFKAMVSICTLLQVCVICTTATKAWPVRWYPVVTGRVERKFTSVSYHFKTREGDAHSSF